jgi:uncharacterized protein YerC
MEKMDLRELSDAELYIVRKQVVRLKNQGYTGKQIETMTGVLNNRISQYGAHTKKAE